MDKDQDEQAYLPFDDNAKNFLFTKDMLDEIILYEKTVELIGVVDNVELKSMLLKFTLTNDTGDIVQILVWDDTIISKIKSFVMTGNTLHIDGAYARLKNNLSNGNCKYDLTVMSNTEVTLLSNSPSYQIVKTENEINNNVEIEDALKLEGKIGVIGYIKNVIKETSLPNSKINQGCLSDCKRHKLEIRMPTVCDMSEFSIGMHVKLIGTIKYSSFPYLWVLKKEDVIKFSDERKKIGEVMKGVYCPNKRPLKD